MSSPSPSPSFQSALLAGALAGISVDLSLFPLDTLKTRLQSSAGFFPSGGFSGIYRGIGSAVVGSAPGAAFFFCTYETTKNLLSPPSTRRQYHENDNGNGGAAAGGATTAEEEGGGGGGGAAGVTTHMVAASAGEIAACAVRVPTEVVKQRAQAGLHGGRSGAALGAILGRYRADGIVTVWRELYRGWGITVFREVPFTVIQFPLWEAMKAWGAVRKQKQREAADHYRSHDLGRLPPAVVVSGAESALYGSIAGGVAAAATTPLDVLKTRVMLSDKSVSVADMFVRMVREEGVRPFFAGIAPRVTWISIGGAIFLGSYQWAVNTMTALS